MGLLQDGEKGPAIVVNGNGASPYILICEHASNKLPEGLGSLGLAGFELRSHIAWDIGAARVARLLAKILDAPLVLQRYSRLVYDCNRPPESPDAMPEVSELTEIPGNRGITATQKLRRICEIYRPFHATVADVLDGRAARGLKSFVVSIHSFTPVYKGKRRAVELGILHDRDKRLAAKLAKSFPGVNTQLNEPYGPKDGVLHTINMHAAPRGLQSAMIEIRNDLITTGKGQEDWAKRLLGPLLREAQEKQGERHGRRVVDA